MGDPSFHISRKRERGNILFYILVAVALFAALSFAVSQGSRSNTDALSSERSKLLASEIIEFGNVMENAVAQLLLRGVDEDQLCFDHTEWGANDYDHADCTDSYNKIFDIGGAGVMWSNAPSEAMDAGASPDNLWHIYGDNEVDNVGSTCGAAACADLILLVDELSQAVCIKLNDELGITNPSGVPPTDTAYGTSRYKGSFGYTATIGDEAGGVNFQGESAACFQNTTTGEYAFYQVLLAR